MIRLFTHFPLMGVLFNLISRKCYFYIIEIICKIYNNLKLILFIQNNKKMNNMEYILIRIKYSEN